MIEFREVDVTRGAYQGTEEITIKIPINVPWVRSDILISCLHKGHTNYWTIIPDTISNRKQLENRSGFVIRYHFFNGVIMLILDNYAPISELEIVPWKELYDKYNLKDLVGVVVGTRTFDVVYVCRVIEMKHPNHATVHFIDFKNLGCHFDCNTMNIDHHVEITNLLSQPLHGKSFILSGDRAKLVWEEAMKTFLAKFNCEEYESKIKWESGLNLEDFHLTDKSEVVNLVLKAEGILAQFKTK